MTELSDLGRRVLAANDRRRLLYDLVDLVGEPGFGDGVERQRAMARLMEQACAVLALRFCGVAEQAA
jgi:hypothetical protein